MNAGVFDDVLAANAEYAARFAHRNLKPAAVRGLAVVTCMDSRIDPLEMLGLRPGDAKIVRNAGAQVSDDVARDLILATHVLDVRRIMIIPHTRCKMASATRDDVNRQILAESGIDVSDLEFPMIDDQVEALRRDVRRIQSSPYLAPGVAVAGFVYDVDTGTVTEVP